MKTLLLPNHEGFVKSVHSACRLSILHFTENPHRHNFVPSRSVISIIERCVVHIMTSNALFSIKISASRCLYLLSRTNIHASPNRYTSIVPLPRVSSQLSPSPLRHSNLHSTPPCSAAQPPTVQRQALPKDPRTKIRLWKSSPKQCRQEQDSRRIHKLSCGTHHDSWICQRAVTSA